MGVLPKRKNIRLEKWDYSADGMYFITICTKDKKHFLSKICVGAIHESPEVKLLFCGRIVDDVIKDIPDHFGVIVDKYVIMPNHIHLLIGINKGRSLHEATLRGRSTISKIIGYLKMNSSKRIHEIYSDMEIWQRSYYDHIIRNEADYLEKRKYIENNPALWQDDEYFNQ